VDDWSEYREQSVVYSPGFNFVINKIAVQSERSRCDGSL